jgi:hypothetical protein
MVRHTGCHGVVGVRAMTWAPFVVILGSSVGDRSSASAPFSRLQHGGAGPPQSGLRVFYDAPSGDRRLEYLNSALSVGSTVLTGDLTGVQPLVPLIYRPSLLTLNGSRFPSGLARGDWTLEAQRLNP